MKKTHDCKNSGKAFKYLLKVPSSMNLCFDKTTKTNKIKTSEKVQDDEVEIADKAVSNNQGV